MYLSCGNILNKCDTLMLDMDGTLLDLAYDSFIWLDLVPERIRKKNEYVFERMLMHNYISILSAYKERSNGIAQIIGVNYLI